MIRIKFGISAQMIIFTMKPIIEMAGKNVHKYQVNPPIASVKKNLLK